MNPVTSSEIQPADSLNLIPPKPVDPSLAGVPVGVYDSIQNELNTVSQQVKQGEELQAQSGSDILNLMQDLTGKTAATQAANEQTGVNTETANLTKYAQQLADLNAQASILSREAQAVPLQIQEQFKNTGATDRGVAPITTGRLRENALRALSIAQQSDIAAAAATGSQLRLQAAKDKAQQIVDLKYKPMEDALAIKKEQYNLNKDILDRYDKKRSEALNIALRKEERELEDKKQKEKQLQDITVEIAKNGAPASLLSKLAKAKTFEEAIVIGGAYMADPLDRSIKAAQLRKLQNENIQNDPTQQQAILNSVINEKDPTKLISSFFKLNPKMKTNAPINDAAAVVSSANELAKTLGGGKVKGYGVFGGGFLPEALLSQESISNRAKIKALNLKVQQWASGASLTKQQTKYVMAMIPERNDRDDTFRNKVNNLTNYMLSDIKGRATTQGGQFEYVPVDMFGNPETSVAPDVKKSVVQAVSAGYAPVEIIQFVEESYPDKATQIQQARDNGYSDDEIIQYLSL